MTTTELKTILENMTEVTDEIVRQVITFSDDLDPYGTRDEYGDFYDDPESPGYNRCYEDTIDTLTNARQEVIDFLQQIIDNETARRQTL